MEKKNIQELRWLHVMCADRLFLFESLAKYVYFSTFSPAIIVYNKAIW